MKLHNDYDTPFYVRSAGGQTGHVDTLEEAMEHFASEDGYRLGITLNGRTTTFFRGETQDGQGSYEARVGFVEAVPHLRAV